MHAGKLLALFRKPHEISFDCDAAAKIGLANPPESYLMGARLVEISQSRFRLHCRQAIPRGSEVHVRMLNALVFGTVRDCRSEDRIGYEIDITTDEVVMRSPNLHSPLPTGASLSAAAGR